MVSSILLANAGGVNTSLPQAGSKNRESIRSVSPFTKSSMASTIQAGVKTSPWSATRCFDLTRLMLFVKSVLDLSHFSEVLILLGDLSLGRVLSGHRKPG